MTVFHEATAPFCALTDAQRYSLNTAPKRKQRAQKISSSPCSGPERSNPRKSTAVSKPLVASAKKNEKQPMKKRAVASAANDARHQCLLRAEAQIPALNAKTKLAVFVRNDTVASPRLTPPIKRGRLNTGTAANQTETARNAWIRLFAVTTSLARKGVRKRRSNVPSRRSRAMQSAVTIGTRIQIAHASERCRTAKSFVPCGGPAS